MKRIAVSLSLCLIALWQCIPAMADQAATQAAREAIAKALPRFTIKSFDESPSVEFGGAKGYRIVACREYKETTGLSQRPDPRYPGVSVTKQEYLPLILFPLPTKVSERSAEKLPWQAVEQRHFHRAVDMGQGLGFEWFANTTLYFQHDLRTKLGLRGGTDPIQLQIDALEIRDDGEMTRNSATVRFAVFGDRALPYLISAIKKHESDDPWYQVMSLGSIRTTSSTKYLRELYASENEKLRKAARYALIGPPYRKEAKKEYLEMLGERVYVQACSEACSEFKWKEALPLLEDIMAEPGSWSDYFLAFKAKRKIEGRPIPEEIIQAGYTFRYYESAQSLDSAVALLTTHTDKEAAAVVATGLAILKGKVDTETADNIHNAGLTIFESLPAEYTRPIIASLKHIPRQKRDNLDPFLGPYQEKPEVTR